MNQAVENINHTALAIVKSAISKQKLLQNMLLSGNGQKDKIDLAKYYLQAVFCSNTQNHEPCSSCQACLLIEKNQHPDVYWYAADAKMGKDVIIQLQTRMSESGLIGKRRAYVIENLSTMTVQAQNAWLKFLEEPLTDVYCIAMIENESQVLPTVKSRFVTLQINQVNNGESAEMPARLVDVANAFLQRYTDKVKEVDLLLFLEKNIKISEDGQLFAEILLNQIIATANGLALIPLISKVRKMASANVPKDQLIVYFCLNVYSEEQTYE